jgi:hypothetical protein
LSREKTIMDMQMIMIVIMIVIMDTGAVTLRKQPNTHTPSILTAPASL